MIDTLLTPLMLQKLLQAILDLQYFQVLQLCFRVNASFTAMSPEFHFSVFLFGSLLSFHFSLSVVSFRILASSPWGLDQDDIC